MPRGTRSGFALIGLLIALAIILICVSFYFTGPGPAPAPESGPAGATPAGPAPTGPVGGPVLTAPRFAALQMRLVEVREAIQHFAALEGRLPASLDELRQGDFTLGDLPAGYTYAYDPADGTVVIKQGDKVVAR
jgi:hypothetical protein